MLLTTLCIKSCAAEESEEVPICSPAVHQSMPYRTPKTFYRLLFPIKIRTWHRRDPLFQHGVACGGPAYGLDDCGSVYGLACGGPVYGLACGGPVYGLDCVRAVYGLACGPTCTASSQPATWLPAVDAGSNLSASRVNLIRSPGLAGRLAAANRSPKRRRRARLQPAGPHRLVAA